MNPSIIGRGIASLRKKAGFTQAALAEFLNVSDKAVSKWERGLSCPDISLLPKLSIVLNTDIDSLINGRNSGINHRWKGILFLDDFASFQVYSKPLVYYLIQNFLLVGIRDVLIIGGNVSGLLGTGEQFGMQFKYDVDSTIKALLNHAEFTSANTMIVFENVLVYGANLTRNYQSIMSYEDDSIDLITDGHNPIPIIFCRKKKWEKLHKQIYKWNSINDMISDMDSVHKALDRGIVALPLNNNDQILEASRFIQIIEKAEKKEIANLYEIADSRGLIQIKSIGE